jgi:hypothetical protein
LRGASSNGWSELPRGIRSLQDNGRIELEAIRNDEQFISTVVQAAQAAARTHVHEKRESLRNAILNSAMPGPIDGTLQQMFVQWVDAFIAWHLRFLTFAESPARAFAERGLDINSFMRGSQPMVIETAFPTLKGKQGLYDQIYNDLSQRGLAEAMPLGTVKHAAMFKQPTITNLGRQFLAFITAPPEVQVDPPPTASPMA